MTRGITILTGQDQGVVFLGNDSTGNYKTRYS